MQNHVSTTLFNIVAAKQLHLFQSIDFPPKFSHVTLCMFLPCRCIPPRIITKPLETNTIMAARKSKNQLRREKAKAAKEAAKLEPDVKIEAADPVQSAEFTASAPATTSQTQPFTLDFDESDERFAEFQKIFDKFDPANVQQDQQELDDAAATDNVMYSDDDYEQEGEELEGEHYEVVRSKKREKIALADLKASTSKPDQVDWHDADALEPFLLVHIKSSPNVVPVPSHWTQKREYLSLKRGASKLLYELPQFIKDTGIMDMRETGEADESTMKQRARERVQPKMGKLDIDYQKLHDAFFKFKTKPRLYQYGDQYFEGKEHEPDLSQYRPGVISAQLREALNMEAHFAPPWLLHMQRHGPPPSYRDLRIPGLNAPIPSGAQWGFHPGGFGKPPVDEHGQPLYGDVFGQGELGKRDAQLLDKTLWGQPGEDEESSSDEEEDEEEEREEEDEEDEAGQGYVDGEFAESREKAEQGRAKGPTEMARDEPLDLRKRRHEEVEGTDSEKTLYRVLPMKKKAVKEMMDTDFVYDLGGDNGQGEKDKLQSNIDSLFGSFQGGK